LRGTMKSMGLEHYYLGAEAFHRFAAACADEWADCPHQAALLAAVGGDCDLAIVLNFHFGNRYQEYLDNRVPDLDGLTPRACLTSDWGLKRLKSCLHRMPC
jgi:hypothetical protein